MLSRAPTSPLVSNPTKSPPTPTALSVDWTSEESKARFAKTALSDTTATIAPAILTRNFTFTTPNGISQPIPPIDDIIRFSPAPECFHWVCCALVMSRE